MKCPNCLVEFHDNREIFPLEDDSEGRCGIEKYTCPHPKCLKSCFFLINAQIDYNNRSGYFLPLNSKGEEIVYSRIMVRPKGTNRAPAPIEVPKEFSQDYTEACIVFYDSPKASSALSRRCLQHILREKAKVKKADLASEIQEIIDSGKLPSHISEGIDAIRNIGNFAAHPLKSKSTGEIIEVEPGEAEWNLDVLEMLFDFFFVQPEQAKLKRNALNKKLNDMGKPPLK
jgi:hypothetical protein